MQLTRNTLQKFLIMEAVHHLQNHPTVEEVYLEVIKKHPNISKSTVYRNLNQLAEDHKIKKVEVFGGVDRFDYKCSNHYHTKCLLCGKIFDLDMEYVNNLEQTVKNSIDFEFLGHDIMFNGVCKTCKTQYHNNNHNGEK